MSKSDQPRYQILVVDDETTVCKAIQMMLKYYGHDVKTAYDGATALAVYDGSQFDLVITDYQMPEMKGDQLVAEIRRRRPEQRIIMATAFAEDFLVYGRPSGGVNHILTKPFSLEELRVAISTVMA